MYDDVMQILVLLTAFSSISFMIAWFLVIQLVNPVLDPVFNNDSTFNWFLRRAHPFFFAYRAQLYAGAVISKWLARRTMAIPYEFEFRDRVGFFGKCSCWAMMILETMAMLAAFAFAFALWVWPHLGF